MKLTTSLALLSTVLLAGNAAAIDGKDVFSALDSDHSSAISTSEAGVDKALTTAFKKFDIDQNGEISKAEFAEFSKSVSVDKAL